MKDKNLTLYQSNKLINAKYDFNAIEKRCLAKIIYKVRKEHVEKEGQRDLLNDLIVTFPFSELEAVDTKLKRVYEHLISLAKRVIEIENEEKWMAVGLISLVEHLKKENTIRITVKKEILPEFLVLAEKFTSTQLSVYMILSSQYSQRLYEFCSQWKNDTKEDGMAYFKTSVTDLKEKLNVTDKYVKYAMFKERVLEKAKNDLKELYDKGDCDLFFEYKEISSKLRKNTIESINFAITTRGVDTVAFKPDDYLYMVKLWLNTWFKVGEKPKNKIWVNDVISHLVLNADKLKPCYDKLVNLQKNKAVEDWAPLARYIITEDYMPNH